MHVYDYTSAMYIIIFQPSIHTYNYISAKYASELSLQQEEINEVRRDEQLVLPGDLDYLRYVYILIHMLEETNMLSRLP